MNQEIGPRVALRIPQRLIDHIDAVRDWRSRSDYIRTLIDLDAKRSAPSLARAQAVKPGPEPVPEPETWHSVRERALAHQYAIQPKSEADDVIAKILSAGGGDEETAWTIHLNSGMKTYRPILEAWEAAQKETPPG